MAGAGTAGHAGGGCLATATELHDPAWVTVDGTGDLVIADTYSYRIRLAATTGSYNDHAMTGWHIYGAAGGGFAGDAGDGGPAIRPGSALPPGSCRHLRQPGDRRHRQTTGSG